MSSPAASAVSARVSAPASQRLVSLDALRGFDMFWILGADALFTTLAKVCDIPPLRLIAGQLDHKDWAGFAFYDLIFPLFVFMSGASLVFALPKIIEREGRAAAVKRVLFRGALLFVVGLFYAGGFQTKWPDIRVLGVLQRIALAYTGAGLLFCFFKVPLLTAACCFLLCFSFTSNEVSAAAKTCCFSFGLLIYCIIEATLIADIRTHSSFVTPRTPFLAYFLLC